MPQHHKQQKQQGALRMTDTCVLCKDDATIGVRGSLEKKYVMVCSFHAGSLQMIFELLNTQDSVKWRPLTDSPKGTDD